jgi:inositol hexakisphosphate/diphosphoinositol-pentakisphosphate kinase
VKEAKEKLKKAFKKTLTTIEEFDDFLVIEGIKFVKPFVEKPFDAENHNIHIYYNSNEGGGCK